MFWDVWSEIWTYMKFSWFPTLKWLVNGGLSYNVVLHCYNLELEFEWLVNCCKDQVYKHNICNYSRIISRAPDLKPICKSQVLKKNTFVVSCTPPPWWLVSWSSKPAMLVGKSSMATTKNDFKELVCTEAPSNKANSRVVISCAPSLRLWRLKSPSWRSGVSRRLLLLLLLLLLEYIQFRWLVNLFANCLQQERWNTVELKLKVGESRMNKDRI